MNNKVYIKLLNDNAKIPTKAHESDAGWDLYVSERVIIPKGEARDIRTGLELALQAGWYGNIKTRSSTLIRHDLHIIEGIIDQGYRGELYIQAVNMTDKAVVVEVGVRIAQFLILPVPPVEWVQVNSLPASPRGRTGFGESGR